MAKAAPTNTSKANISPPIDLSTWQARVDLVRFVQRADELTPHLQNHINKIINESPIKDKYRLLFLYDPEGSIREWTADQIYTALTKSNDQQETMLLLIVQSPGGSVEAAYFVSKACKELSKKFIVSIPRKAKSAATLLALGADEIHMGLMSQLGPIDPQVGNLPALGVGDAIHKMAMLCEQYPKSAEMFARYLYFSIEPAVLGYMDRIPESAVQYAQRLLEGKVLPQKPGETTVGQKLVYEYKSHGFVIDKAEAQKLLGEYVKTDTEELKLGEQIYKFLEEMHLLIKIIHKNHLSVIGDLENGFSFFEIREN